MRKLITRARRLTYVSQKRFISVLIAILMVVILSDSPADAWSTSDGAVLINSTSSSTGSVFDVQVDDSGNVYSCGHFRGTGDVDPDPGNTENETATGLNSSLAIKS